MTGAALVLDWEEDAPGRYAQLMREAPVATLEQHWTYGEAVVRHSRYRARRGIFRLGSDPVALIQSFEMRLPIVPVVWVKTLRGPVFLGSSASAPDIVSAVHRIVRGLYAKRRGQFHFWMPEMRDGVEAQSHMRRLGLRPMLTGYASAELDLTPDPDALRRNLRGKWRNALVRAEAEALKVETVRGGAWLDWLAGAHDEQRRRQRFNAPSGAMIRSMAAAAPRDCLCLVALQKREPVAGALFFRHGPGATYYVGVAGTAGRAANAQNLLLWRALLALRDDGVRSLDLGGIDTVAESGIARFKLGLGATPFSLSGTWA